MVWAYFCWRDGGGLVIAFFSLPVGVADFCGCRVFGGLPVAGQNDCVGLPRPQRCYGGLLTGGSTADCSTTPAKLQQSSKKTTSDIAAPNPAGFLECFLVVHPLGAPAFFLHWKPQRNLSWFVGIVLLLQQAPNFSVTGTLGPLSS
ncbi:hypothetical protein NDU88_009392 [Pleurodeles waltl]|uniref:Secreted protein n=1 Tax=Pleurodeles waltl TaxID=8319 RepID=A0AAV7PV33_PLEWA|nr:hypothetical protein NDU88_009392 [Pleurodeles waltl]